MNKIKSTIVLVLLLAMPFAPFLANASSGTVNVLTGPPPLGTIVVGPVHLGAGANITLDFHSVIFSGAQFYLVWSSNGFSQISSGDFVFTPTITTADLTALKFTAYTSTIGNYTVGYDAVTGPIPKNIAGGDYYIKCYDGSADSVAVTSSYVNVLPILEVTPFTRGAGGSPISLEGTAFTANSAVELTYYDPITTVNETLATVSTDAQGNFTYATTAPDLKQWIPAGDNPITFNIIKFFSNDTATGYQAEADYMEGRRGLLQVGNVYSPSGDMFGNNTGFSTVQVYVNESLIIVGNYFHPPAVIIYFDNTAIGTAQTNSSGFFNTTVRVPITSMGTHTITLEDAVNQTSTVTTTTTITTMIPTTTTSTITTTTTTTTSTTTPSGPESNLLIPAVIVVFIVIVAAAAILLLRSRRKQT